MIEILKFSMHLIDNYIFSMIFHYVNLCQTTNKIDLTFTSTLTVHQTYTAQSFRLFPFDNLPDHTSLLSNKHAI